jgi:hypothetical protein
MHLWQTINTRVKCTSHWEATNINYSDRIVNLVDIGLSGGGDALVLRHGYKVELYCVSYGIRGSAVGRQGTCLVCVGLIWSLVTAWPPATTAVTGAHDDQYEENNGREDDEHQQDDEPVSVVCEKQI